jgi:dipeptidyl aminopeptidase/acylaminoacyl peptidase
MAHRILAGAVAGLAVLAAAPAADARLVYVRHVDSARPQVWAARDGGGHRRELGRGSRPALSPDGTRVAWVDGNDRRRAVWVADADGSGRPRRVVRARDIGEVAFSPDGRRLAIALPAHLTVYDAASRRRAASVRARVRGLAFSADSARVVYGAPRGEERSDLHVLDVATGATTRLTADGRSGFPAWGADGTVVFDRITPRRRDAPVFQLWALDPGATQPRPITRMRVPRLTSGLVPVEVVGSTVLAEFVGQDTDAGFTVDLGTGRIRALSRRLENGFAAADLSADGRTVLGTAGVDVVTVPARGGRATVLVHDAAQPRFSR